MTKKTMKALLGGVIILTLTAGMTSGKPKGDNVMTKEDGMYVVNTTTLGEGVTGYVSTTPVKVYIKKDRIVKVVAMKNEETPKYMAKVKKNLMSKWDGMRVKDAQSLQVDGVTGATFTSEAIKENVKLALEYYKKIKK